MKRIILGISLLVSIFILTFVNIGVLMANNVRLNVIENVIVNPTPGYTMQNKACPGDVGLYMRCIPWEDSTCDVSKQTLCD